MKKIYLVLIFCALVAASFGLSAFSGGNVASVSKTANDKQAQYNAEKEIKANNETKSNQEIDENKVSNEINVEAFDNVDLQTNEPEAQDVENGEDVSNETQEREEEGNINCESESEDPEQAITSARDNFINKMNEIFVALNRFDSKGTLSGQFDENGFKEKRVEKFTVEDFEAGLILANNALEIYNVEIESLDENEVGQISKIENDDDKIWVIQQLGNFIINIFMS